MKKMLLAAFVAAVLVSPGEAKVNVTVAPTGEKPNAKSAFKAVTTSTDSYIVRENFELLSAGSEDDPDMDVVLANVYENPEIDANLTHGAQWLGHKVYSAGGACAVATKNPQDLAFIATPKGDYSGHVKVEFDVKCYPMEWDNDYGHNIIDGASVYVGIYNDSGRAFNVEDAFMPQQLASPRIYVRQGWCHIVVEFDNHSAYNDAYIQFSTPDAMLIDNVVITSSIDKFIASPAVTGVSDITETSFTVNFEPVRHSYNYYVYLYVLDGYDETGLPKYKYVKPGWTPEEYKEVPDNAYHQYGKVEADEPTHFTFTELDPSIDYYYAVCSHNVNLFSDIELIPANFIASPIPGIAENITETGFTATWNPIVKADSYLVNLYGVNQVMEDEDNFIIFEEDFENVSDYTEATDIWEADEISSESGITLDDLTSTPGWQTVLDFALICKGYFGLNEWNPWLVTPSLYVAGADEIIVSLRAEMECEDMPFYIMFAGVEYEVPVSGSVFENEFRIPTNGLAEASLYLTGPEGQRIFFDYIFVSQDLKKGAFTYTWLGDEPTNELKYDFTDLNPDAYDMYGFSVNSVRGEGFGQLISEQSDKILVDVRNGNCIGTGIVSVGNSPAEVVEIGRYSLDGRKLTKPVAGINIVHYSDGSVRKVLIK